MSSSDRIEFQAVRYNTTSGQRRIRGFMATGETRHVSEVSRELEPKVPLPKTEKSADLAHHFFGSGQILSRKKSNIERERVGFRSEPDFYWGNFPVNFKVQNPSGESFPIFPSGGYAHGSGVNYI